MKRHIVLSKLAKRGAASCLLLAMLAFAANTAVGQVQCTDASVSVGSLDLVTFAAGAHVAESGAGLAETESGTASVDIPAGATIVDAFVYWAVRQETDEPAGSINLTVNGGTTNTVEGDCIGVDPDGDPFTPYAFKHAVPTSELNAGATNTVEVEVLDPNLYRADGFSVVVLYTLDGSSGHSEFYEGNDFIWDETDPSSSLFISGPILEQCAGNDLTLHLKVGDTTPDRPDRLTIDIDGSTFLEEFNFFGDQALGWESQWSDREIIIGDADYGAGSTIEVELASVEHPVDGGDPSSLVWVVAGVTCSTSDEVAGCTRTPGYWRNQGFRSGVLATALASAKIQFPDAFDGDPWAGDLSVNDARGILNQDSCSDISYCLEKHLLAAILNVANGATNTISDAIADAIDFLDSDISVDAEDLKDTLDRFNNGLEGPPSCDSLEDEVNGIASTLTHSVGPNPFNPTTQIHFALGESMPVRLAVYDVLGREVRLLLDETVNAGEHRVNFDANGLPTGAYFYRFVTPDGIFGGQMILMK